MALLTRLKDLMPKRLFARSLLIIIAPVVLTQAIVTYIFFERHWDTVTRRLSRAVAGEVALIAETYQYSPDAAVSPEVKARLIRALQLKVAFMPGEKLPAPSARDSIFIPETVLEEELDKQLALPFWFDATKDSEQLDVRVQLDAGVLRILAPHNRVTSHTARIFISWMLGISLVLLGVAILFLRNQVRPITLLAQAAEEFGKGREVPDFRPAGAAEVRQAAAAFLEMRDRIKRQIAQRTLMLAGVSHDLRTPLTRMNLQLAMLPDGEDIEGLRADVREMQYMLDEYLAFARGQAGEAESQVDVGNLLEEIAADCARRGKPLRTHSNGAPALPLRRGAFKRCMINLVDNALAHGNQVELGADRIGDQIEITIDDDGPGLPADKYEEAFLPFQRFDESRNQDQAGVGLGLAIARDIARSHGGDILLSRSHLGGLRATITVPL